MDGSDYVNANFIEVLMLSFHYQSAITNCLISLSFQGYHKGKAFIATQGPLPDTSEDFWRMVWEYKSSTIVMLAKEKEGAKVKQHNFSINTHLYTLF